MSKQLLLSYMADTILVIHALFAFFVVFGLFAIYFGYLFKWRWIRNRVFRITHLFAIGFVVVQSWLGAMCPLTTLEMELRAEAGSGIYSGSFIQHWLHRLLYFTAPDWVFILVYTAFGGLVLASWFLIRPNTR